LAGAQLANESRAPINHGNSGGPTLDFRAQVIGINTAIYLPSGSSVGTGSPLRRYPECPSGNR
jgi:S1-C subfamily serine protease